LKLPFKGKTSEKGDLKEELKGMPEMSFRKVW